MLSYRAWILSSLLSLVLVGCVGTKRIETQIHDLENRLAAIESAVERNEYEDQRRQKEIESQLEQLRRDQIRQLAGSANPNVDHATFDAATHEYRVWFGTNRKPWSYRSTFSDERDHALHYGSCWVHIPESHQLGEIGSYSFFKIITGKDDRLRLREVRIDNRTKFFDDIDGALDETSLRAVLVYIHGYNVSFEDAAIRAAQIGFDLNVDGVTAFFSWPSKGSLDGYVADEASIEASERYLEEFLRGFISLPEAGPINVIAHSMGNRAFLRVLERMTATTSDKLFNQIVLAAPDIDAELFEHLAGAYGEAAARTTLYVSEEDRALEASGFLHDFHRAGFGAPMTVTPGIDTVEVSDIDLTLLGHGYFAEAERILRDIRRVLQKNLPPDERGLKQAEAGHWQFR